MSWGEAPRFPPFEQRFSWASGHLRLTAGECTLIVRSAVERLRDRYGMDVPEARLCVDCGYPRTDLHDCPATRSD